MMIDKCWIVKSEDIPTDKILQYFKDLQYAKCLEKRFCDLTNPTPESGLEMSQYHLNLCHFVIDRETLDIMAEFMLENYTGKAAQVHFSMHPSNPFKQSLQIAIEVTDDVLSNWKTPSKKSSEDKQPYLETLYGMTPITNRAACIFVLKTGFRKIGVLPNGIYDQGVLTDAMLTIKTREA